MPNTDSHRPVVTLRPFLDADTLAVIELRAVAFESLAAGHYSKEQLEAARRRSLTSEYGATLRKCRLMLAIDPVGTIIGAAGWSLDDYQPGRARIRKVFVHPMMARRGIGSRLVADAEARAKAAGFNLLTVRSTLNAVPFYR